MLQLGRIYLDMLNVYKVMSENITAAVTHNGEQVREGEGDGGREGGSYFFLLND